ncbi:MAG: S8 family serine peptidase, partial [Actinomycetota bacterium]|nr:S8 family serine peptidase [Actinomycetota bacterium]
MITRLTNSTLRFLLVATLLATSLPAESVRATDGSVATLSAPTDAERSVLVRTRAGVPHDWTTRQAASAGLRFVREVPRLGWYVFEPSGSTSSRAAAAMLRSSALVDRVEVDGVAVTASAPNDPLYPGLWGLNNTGQDGGTPGSDIGAEVAWDVTTGSDDVVVAVIDTGVDLAHPDLAANAWVNTGEIPGNGIDDDGNGYIDDVVGYNFAARNGTVFDPTHVDAHGTHVAGTIGAVGDNG